MSYNSLMLYFIGVPIGNVEDMTLRAVKTLREVDVVYAEDTQSFERLWKAMHATFDIQGGNKPTVKHLHDKNEFSITAEVIAEAEDKNVAIVSEAGMPLVSDPGGFLSKKAIQAGIEIVCIPGVSSLTMALVYAGVDSAYMFAGFLSKKDGQKKAVFGQLTKDMAIVFFESPHRIQATLKLLGQERPEAQVTICRELTKTYEEVIHGKPAELALRTYRGELTVVAYIR